MYTLNKTTIGTAKEVSGNRCGYKGDVDVYCEIKLYFEEIVLGNDRMVLEHDRLESLFKSALFKGGTCEELLITMENKIKVMCKVIDTKLHSYYIEVGMVGGDANFSVEKEI